jgi:hypothetical protein
MIMCRLKTIALLAYVRDTGFESGDSPILQPTVTNQMDCTELVPDRKLPSEGQQINTKKGLRLPLKKSIVNRVKSSVCFCTIITVLCKERNTENFDAERNLKFFRYAPVPSGVLNPRWPVS